MKIRKKTKIPVPVPADPVKRVVPESVKVECPVRTDEKVSDVLSEPEPDRVEIVRNGSVAKEPLVVAVSSTSAAPAIPYTRRSPCEGESKSQHVRCLSDLVAPATLPPGTTVEPRGPAPALEPLEPVPVLDPTLIQLLPVIPVSVETPYVKHSLNPDGSCCCGDTGCDGPPVPVFLESSSVCSLSQILPTSKVVPSSTSFVMTNISSSFCRSPVDEKMMMTKKKMAKKSPDESKMPSAMMKGKNKNNNTNNAAELAAFGWEITQGAACKQRTLKEPPWSDLSLR